MMKLDRVKRVDSESGDVISDKNAEDDDGVSQG